MMASVRIECAKVILARSRTGCSDTRSSESVSDTRNSAYPSPSGVPGEVASHEMTPVTSTMRSTAASVNRQIVPVAESLAMISLGAAVPGV